MPAGYRRERALFLGHDLRDNAPLYLSPKWLRTGLHVLGRTGSGKTRLLLSFVKQLIASSHAAIVVINAKGDFGRMVRDATVAAGQARRLVMFDPGDTTSICGYNPLHSNAELDPYVQAKAARDAILAGLGQTSLEQTPQLARFLYLALTAARLCKLTMVDALELLLPDSEVRPRVLAKLRDPHLVRALSYFANLRESRQDELAASTIARLEAFVSDPIIRRHLTQQTHTLDLGAVIRERQILDANFELYKPLRPNEAKMLGRLLINDVIAHTFGRSDYSVPVYLIVDEIELFATPDLVTAVDLGREMGLRLIAAHQNVEQLVLEDNNQKLRHAMLSNAVTKMIVGAPTFEDLQALGPELFADDFDPMAVKDEITSLELDPIEERRQSFMISRSRSVGRSRGSNRSEAATRGVSASNTRTMGTASTRGQSRGFAVGLSYSETEADSSARSHVITESEGTSESESTATLTGASTVETVADDACSVATGSSSSTVAGYGRSSSQSRSVADGVTHAHMHARTVGRTNTSSENVSRSETENKSHADSEGFSSSRTLATGASEEEGCQEGSGVAIQDTPWHTYRKRRVVSSRTFWSYEEYLLERFKQVRGHGVGIVTVKVPARPVAFVRAPYVKAPTPSATSRARALETMRALPYYAPPESVAVDTVESDAAPPKRPRPRFNQTWDFALPTRKK